MNTGAECATKSKYEIVASILHLGGSIHMGHYVCYAKKDGKWVYYNDSKVHDSLDTPLGKSYMLILKRKD